MFYYLMQDEKIVLADTNRERLEGSIAFVPQYKGLKILETEKEIVNLENGFFFKEDVQEELDAKEAERIAMLKMTGTDVERAILKVKDMDFDDILAYVTKLQPDGLDIKALKVELKANNFYRGNPYVDEVGALLGFTKEQLNAFFEDGNYEHLLPPVDEETEGD